MQNSLLKWIYNKFLLKNRLKFVTHYNLIINPIQQKHLLQINFQTQVKNSAINGCPNAFKLRINSISIIKPFNF